MTTLDYLPPTGAATRFRATGLEGYSPWRHLGELDGVGLTHHDGGPVGITNFEARTISLQRGMTSAERRSTLAHELVHIERGPAIECTTTGENPVEEFLVEATAAARLIPAYVMVDLPDLVRLYGLEAACGFLVVDVETVRCAVKVAEAVRAS